MMTITVEIINYFLSPIRFSKFIVNFIKKFIAIINSYFISNIADFKDMVNTTSAFLVIIKQKQKQVVQASY